jgi:SAM-dependent methyltransferase
MASPLSEPLPWNLVAAGYREHIVPIFTFYAERALELADVDGSTRVLDVACGPGTLTFLAAPQVDQVTSLDFSRDMIAELEARKKELGADNVTALVGDGQALPFEDDAFDAAFSMFGLMFFPDRHKGFTELARVLRPGGAAVVSSWLPIDGVPLMRSLFQSLKELLPNLPLGDGAAPLSSRDVFAEEMRAAGFRDVAIHEVVQTLTVPSARAFWQSNLESSAPVALLRKNMPTAAFEELSKNMVAKLEAEFGTGEYSGDWPAFLGFGRSP